MQIIFRLKDFSLELFPDLKKFSENIKNSIDSIKSELESFYTVGPFVPNVTIEDDIAIIDIDTETIDQYYDDFQKAVDLSEKRKFNEAKQILEKLLKLNPSISEFHRVYGQILEVEGNYNEAKNYIIDALRWNPKNKYALIMMGNILARQDDDFESANKYYNEVLAIDPNDHIALNNIGGNLANVGKFEDAGRYFDIALGINDTYPNTYYGISIVSFKKGDYLKSFENAIKATKLSFEKDKGIYEYSQGQAGNAALEFIKLNKIKDIIDKYKNKIQNDCGKEIKFEEKNDLAFTAQTQYAENHNREYHLILYKSDTPALQHFLLHELTHIDFATQARTHNNNKLFVVTNEQREKFIRNCEKQISKLNEAGLSEKNITDFINSLFNGLTTQIFNAPIDLFIENFLYNNFTENRPYQYFALKHLHKQYLEGAKHKELKKFTPNFVRESNIIMNLTHAYQYFDLFGVDIHNEYPDLHLYKSSSRRLYNEYNNLKDTKKPGEEYTVINNWAKYLRLDKYYKLITEEEHKKAKLGKKLEEIIEDLKIDPLNLKENKRTDNIKRVSFTQGSAGSMAVVMYCLSALQLFDGKDNDFIREVTFEIALLGTYGLDPYNKEKHYSLKSIPGKQFTALQLLSYEYVGFQHIDSSLDTALDFQNELELAKKMFNNESNL